VILFDFLHYSQHDYTHLNSIIFPNPFKLIESVVHEFGKSHTANSNNGRSNGNT